jgi:hypothetical protein
MELKTLTWNIGGGKLRQDGADPLRTATTHDKGFSSCVVSIGGTQIEVTTLRSCRAAPG